MIPYLSITQMPIYKELGRDAALALFKKHMNCVWHMWELYVVMALIVFLSIFLKDVFEITGVYKTLVTGLTFGLTGAFLPKNLVNRYLEKHVELWKTSNVAQQVDSAEASTIAVPPSEPSGSPR